MLFVLIGLWTIGLLLLITDPKRETTRWSSSITFTGGSGAMAAVISDYIRPLLLEHGYTAIAASDWLWKVERAFSLLCYYGLPYTFLMFAIVYYPGYSSLHWKRRIALLLLFPVVLSFAFPPSGMEPIPYRYAIWWATAYIVTGIALLILATLKEKNSFLRRNRLLTTTAAAPPLFFVLFTMYWLPTLLDVYVFWRHNTWVILFTMAIIVVSSFRYGFLGLQISIQNERLDYTLRAITSGTSILNHAIKNDVGKIQLFGEKVKSEADAGRLDSEQVRADMEVILASSRHIYEMIGRIQGQTQDIRIRTAPLKLSELLARCLSTLAINRDRIDVSEQYMTEGNMAGDEVQLAEVFTNVFMNALDAMPEAGSLLVKLTETKRKFVLEVKDTGIGMDKKQLKRAFDPFYTTKTGKKMNFGLGLSYCYNIIQKHKGTMSLHSKPGLGTSVFIQFPKPKRTAEQEG